MKITAYEYKPISERIRKARLAKNYTQEYVAMRCNVDKTQISQIEIGKSGISIPTLMSLSDVLEISADYILFGEGSHKNTDPLSAVVQELSETQKERAIELLRVYADGCKNR